MAAQNFFPAKTEEPTTGTGPCSFYLKMRGLPWNSTKEDIMSFFKNVPLEEDHIQILFMPDGKASGECLVGFVDESSKDQAMEFEKQFMQKRYIELYPSDETEWNRCSNRETRTLKIPISETSHILMMRGLPYSAHEDDCMAFFENLPCLGVHLPKSNGRPSGQGYAEFETRELLNDALKFNKKHMNRRYIELFESSQADLRKAMDDNRNKGAFTTHAPFGGFQPPGMPYGGGPGNPYTTHVITQKPCCLRMRGLPFNTQENEITQFFQVVHVTPTRIHKKTDGAEAYVEFSAPAELQKALSRDKAFLGKRYVELFEVNYDDMASTIGLPRFGGMPEPGYGDYHGVGRGRGGGRGYGAGGRGRGGGRGGGYGQQYNPYGAPGGGRGGGHEFRKNYW